MAGVQSRCVAAHRGTQRCASRTTTIGCYNGWRDYLPPWPCLSVTGRGGSPSDAQHRLPINATLHVFLLTSQVIPGMHVKLRDERSLRCVPTSLRGHSPAVQQMSCAAVELARQFRRMMKDPIPGISAAPCEDDPFTWLVKLHGPVGSPYQGGWFDVVLTFPADFPKSMPRGVYKTPIWHPNVGAHGRICVSMGRRDESSCAIECVLVGLHMLLSTPNPDSPLNGECAEQYKKDNSAYRKKAREMTRLHAMSELLRAVCWCHNCLTYSLVESSLPQSNGKHVDGSCGNIVHNTTPPPHIHVDTVDAL